MTAWYKNAFQRSVVDMHISADDERFLSEFDPQAYVQQLVKGQVQSTVLYANSHAGLCTFPTRVGKMHPGLKGRDVLAEVSGLCRDAGIAVVVYVSLIYDTWAYRGHPEWKICSPDGKPVAEESRYGVCCPNSTYRGYVQALVEELCAGYEFEGIRFDMTFWPRVCYCPACRERFAREVGGELPTTIDWSDPAWVAFQRARERWLVDFARMATDTVRRSKLGASVEHQASTYPLNWRFGVSADLVEQNDFLQGDFYGDALQGSFVRKLLTSLSPNRPIGFETSFSMDLSNSTAYKSEELLRCKAAAAMLDGAAFIMIDSIDPLGTLNPAVYERMGRVFAGMNAYQPYWGGEALEDVAIYFSTESKYDPADNGRNVDDPFASARLPHVEAALGACKALLDAHIPFGVVTRRNLGRLGRFKAILLPNVLMLSREEADALREYVRAGGALYASGVSSLQTSTGQPQADFLLGDVFGVTYRGETREKITYIAPTPGWEQLFGDYSRKYPAGYKTSQLLVGVLPGAEVLGEVVLPFSDPADPHHFASIHNNPPGRWSGSPALVLQRSGKGRCLYATTALEQDEYSRDLFTNLVQLLAGHFSLQAKFAPKAVEIHAFQQADQRRTILHLVNFQKELPNIPVANIAVALDLNGKIPRQVLLLPDQQPLDFVHQGDRLEFSLPRLETVAQVAVLYED